MNSAPITLFADFTCPFSHATEAALHSLAAEREREVVYRAFELYPVPASPVAPADEAGWEDAVRPLAEELGLAVTAPEFRPRTRKAHEAARFAREHGAEREMRRLIYRAYWAEGLDIGRIDVLMALAERTELDPIQLKIELDIDRYREDVLRDGALAERLRITGVPTLFIGTGPEARILIGAQSPAALRAALSRYS